MRIPRMLSLPLLVSMWSAPGVAQSTQDHAPAVLPNPFAAQPPLGSRIPPMDFYGKGKEGSAHGLTSPTLKRLNPFVFHPNDLYAQQASHPTVCLAVPGTQMAQNSERCYAIRDYRFSQAAPQSDATKPSGFSTCLPADQVHPKTTR